MESGIFQEIEPQRIYVRFGGKIKTVLFTSNKIKDGYIGFQELDVKMNVGDNHEEKWDKEKPSVFLYFDNTKSIDMIIGVLEELKEKLNNFKIENHVLRDDNESNTHK